MQSTEPFERDIIAFLTALHYNDVVGRTQILDDYLSYAATNEMVRVALTGMIHVGAASVNFLYDSLCEKDPPTATVFLASLVGDPSEDSPAELATLIAVQAASTDNRVTLEATFDQWVGDSIPRAKSVELFLKGANLTLDLLELVADQANLTIEEYLQRFGMYLAEYANK